MTWRDRARQAVEKNRGGTPPTKPTKPTSVSFVSTPPPTFSRKERDYSTSDLAEMDRLIRELAQLEGWENDELEQMLDERRRMAPCNVRKALAALRIATREALAPWPDRPANRARITLCELASRRRELVVLDGGA
jgi:hypothetical protein